MSFEEDFLNENHIEEFKNALDYEDDSWSFSRSPSMVSLNEEPIELISSKNDWLPIHRKITKPGSPGHKRRKSFSAYNNVFQSGWTFKFLRFPILAFILLWMFVLFLCYFVVRIYVAFYEFFFAWTGERRKLRDRLRHSESYQEWIDNARSLDKFLKYDQWRKDDRFFCYDWKTVRRIVTDLADSVEKKDVEKVVSILQNCVKANFASTENPLLYSQCYYGTKKLIEIYNKLVVDALEFVIDDESMPSEDKKVFFKALSKNFGKSALCLSGGACFAYSHFGILKALIENDAMPTIVSGTSGGGLVAALACVRTNDELRQLIVPELANKITACSDPFSVWFKRWWKTGARFDPVDWAKKCSWFTMGSLTFKEAYERTGKILNISTVPSDPHSPVILCNHITSPDCVIWSALLASSAVPGILPPVVLMSKRRDGSITSFSFGSKWKDGSLRTDIPVEALNTYYNVKYSIVSQVNPHISLFFYAPKGSVGRPVSRRTGTIGLRGGFIGAALENLLKLEITKWLKLIRDFDLLPRIMDQDWSNIWLQRFSGTVTLWPKIKLGDFRYILSDPTPERLEKMIASGELCAYPKLLFIKHRLAIERAIERGRREVRKQSGRKSRGNTMEQGVAGVDLTAQFSQLSESPFDNSDLDGHGNVSFETRFHDDDDEDTDTDEPQSYYDDDSDRSEEEKTPSVPHTSITNRLSRRASSWW
ncbi:unnamed protein product [Kuraishia capsulata CBS 1993]|uniref:Patatin-like phospholipase domain-containing protein n=1 Tax=Kuraishia capsulata CBS 1993 TaxID=1382522 RepID=W6MSY7_9ASCO|nr:uncharacterized protein KUCA_T00005930001 [Kuraishia capsulata CBS 1993]CDK29936.1 unnamed protein product [Kuraishia capsulata CBS 1993]